MPSAEQLERSRDLKSQMDDLRRESDQEIIFKETSPPRRYVALYSRVDGEPVQVPEKMAEKALEKRLPDGSYMFTTRIEEAPEYKMGQIKCFLHEESPERLSGILDEVGLTGVVCPAGHLASLYSKRIHAQHRHRQQWESYQEHIALQKTQEQEDRQQKQLEATLALAGRVAGVEPEVVLEQVRHDCPDCGWENVKNTEIGLQTHQKQYCKGAKETTEDLTKEAIDASTSQLDMA